MGIVTCIEWSVDDGLPDLICGHANVLFFLAQNPIIEFTISLN